MTVTERHMAAGEFEVSLITETPRSTLDKIAIEKKGVGFCNLIITPDPIDVRNYSDADILTLSRYTGIYRNQPDDFTLRGAGPSIYIADEDGKGPSYTGGLSSAHGYFAEWAQLLKPSWMVAGRTSTIGGAFPKSYGPTNLGDPLAEVRKYFGAEWRVRPDLKFDFGLPADLFRMTPKALIRRELGEGGHDIDLTSLDGTLKAKRDVEDWSRRIALLTGDTDAPTVTIANGGVAAVDVPYRAGDGSALPMDRFIDASNAPAGTEAGLAAAQYGIFKDPHVELEVSSKQYDLGDRAFNVGDNIYVYDPLRGLVDFTIDQLSRGEIVHPKLIRCVGMTWPITLGMGVYIRRWIRSGSTWSVDYIDLTNYVVFESSDTTVEAGSPIR